MKGSPKTHPVLSCIQALTYEEKLLGGDSDKIRSAMKEVSEKLAHQILLDFNEFRPVPRDPRILVLAGKGHNGGDALLAARLLLRSRPRGEVLLWPMESPDNMNPLTLEAYDALVAEEHCRVLDAGVASIEYLKGKSFDLCLDGVLGMQFRPPLSEDLSTILDCVNELEIGFRAAVDLPSGLARDGESGGFRADFTYATGILKSPLLEKNSVNWTGRLRYLDIGFFSQQQQEVDLPDWQGGQRVMTEAVLEDLQHVRHPDCDKRSFGHLMVIAGSTEMPGAALLTVKAALRSGVGLVTAFVPQSVAPAFAAAVPEAMWVPCEETDTGSLSLDCAHRLRRKLPRATALAIGPGMGTERETRALVEEVIRTTTVPVVMDADALQQALVQKIKGPYVLTPHIGEFARLSSTLPEMVNPDLLWKFTREFGLQGAIVLKGPITWVAAGESLAMSPFGSSALARAGSGDLLTGLIGGLLAAGYSSVDAARMGVVWHGLAGEHLARNRGHVSVSSSMLLNYLHEPIRP
jgi:hydroxyethylthiazole kinase-like uncharacterized protein yjeF